MDAVVRGNVMLIAMLMNHVDQSSLLQVNIPIVFYLPLFKRKQ